MLTYHTMITLLEQNRTYCNQNNIILHLVSLMALQAAPSIGMTEPLNSVPESSNRHVQLLTLGNFKII